MYPSFNEMFNTPSYSMTYDSGQEWYRDGAYIVSPFCLREKETLIERLGIRDTMRDMESHQLLMVYTPYQKLDDEWKEYPKIEVIRNGEVALGMDGTRYHVQWGNQEWVDDSLKELQPRIYALYLLTVIEDSVLSHRALSTERARNWAMIFRTFLDRQECLEFFITNYESDTGISVVEESDWMDNFSIVHPWSLPAKITTTDLSYLYMSAQWSRIVYEILEEKDVSLLAKTEV